MDDSMTPPLLFDLRGKRVYVAGHSGLAGSAIVRGLASEGSEILTTNRQELDLTHQDATEKWILQARPDAIFLAAARVGGIYANDAFPADFIADNLAIGLNVIRAAVAAKVKKLMFLGSSCVFPRNAPQPMTEDLLLTGALEPTNEWYAVAKIAGLKLVEAYRRQFGADFISVMPTNLYGPGDNYHPENSHVPAALIRRFHEAKVKGAEEVVVWGTGKPKREFLAADDLGRTAPASPRRVARVHRRISVRPHEAPESHDPVDIIDLRHRVSGQWKARRAQQHRLDRQSSALRGSRMG